MKAVVYKGPYEVAVEEVPDAQISVSTDAIVRITTTNICGSDLHMYEGRTDIEAGRIIGHENMGIVEEVGAGVQRLRVGDRVSLPFNVACGNCYNCEHGWTSYCQRMNPMPGMDGAAYGYADMGPYAGGQAEYLLVPFADFNALELPPGDDFERDFTMLSDIFPTAWHATELAGQQPGDEVVVYGGGPVGLLAAHSAMLRGAAKCFLVDKAPDRLKLAEEFGAIPIDFSQASPVEQILEATDGRGVDCGVEAVGYQAHDPTGEEHPELVLDNLIQSVRTTGGIGVIGVYVPADPGGSTEEAQQGRIPFNFGQFWLQGQHMGTGQAPVKRYNRQLRDLIIAGRATPSKLISHELSLDEAVDAYDKFDKRVEGYTKVILHPAAA